MSLQSYIFIGYQQIAFQRAEKVISDSPGLVDFAIWLMFFLFLTYLTGKCCFLGKFKLQKDCYQSCQSKRVLGLVEMTCGLVHAIYSLPEWQAVKLTYFTPCFHTWQVYRFLSVLSSHVDRFSPAGPSQKTKKKP